MLEISWAKTIEVISNNGGEEVAGNFYMGRMGQKGQANIIYKSADRKYLEISTPEKTSWYVMRLLKKLLEISTWAGRARWAKLILYI